MAKKTIKLDPDAFGSLALCALRYCYGRQTYMPSTIQIIVASHLHEMEDRDIYILMNEEKDMVNEPYLFGDGYIDRPNWEAFWQRVRDEHEFRAKNIHERPYKLP